MAKKEYYSRQIAAAYGISEDIAYQFIEAVRENFIRKPSRKDVYWALCENSLVHDPLSLAEIMVTNRPSRFQRSKLDIDNPKLPDRILHPEDALKPQPNLSKLKKKKSHQQRKIGKEQRQKAKYREPHGKQGMDYSTLVSKVALLIPTPAEERLSTAKRFLAQIERSYSPFLKLSNEDKLKAIEQAKNANDLSLYGVIEKARKLFYRYKNDPDNVRVIYTPMGGKNK